MSRRAINENARVVRRCAVANCDSFYMTMGENPRKLFNIPKDEHIRSVWIANMRILHYTKTSKVCDLHFEDHCFNSTLRNRLIKYAVPTILPGFFDVSETYIPDVHSSPRKKKVQERPTKIPITEEVTVEVVTSENLYDDNNVNYESDENRNASIVECIEEVHPAVTITEEIEVSVEPPPPQRVVMKRRRRRIGKGILQPSHEPKLLVRKFHNRMHTMRKHMRKLQSKVIALKSEIVALKTSSTADSE